MDTHQKKCLVIMGMHRSGSSLISGILARSGVDFRLPVFPVQFDNPKGFYEHIDLVQANEALLKALGGSYDDENPLPQDWLRNPLVASYRTKIKALLERDFDGSALFAIKDPRLSLLFPLYREIFEELGIKPYLVITERTSGQIIKSLENRNKFPPEKTMALIKKYYDSIAAFENDFPSLRLRMEDMIAEPLELLEKISAAFNLALSPDENAKKSILDFVTPELKHHKQSDTDYINTLLRRIRQDEQELGKETDFEAILKRELHQAVPDIRAIVSEELNQALPHIKASFNEEMSQALAVQDEIKKIETKDYIESILKKEIQQGLFRFERRKNNERIQKLLAEVEKEKSQKAHSEAELAKKDKLLKAKDLQVQVLEKQFSEIRKSMTWKAVAFYDRCLRKILPENSRLGMGYTRLIHRLQGTKNKPFLQIEPVRSGSELKAKEAGRYPEADILFINHEETRTGAPRVLFDLMRHADKEIKKGQINKGAVRFKSMLIVSRKQEGMHQEFQNAFGEKLIYPENDFPDAAKIERARRVLKQVRPKLVYINTIVPYEYGIVAKELGIPAILHVHDAPQGFKNLFGKKIREFPSYADNFIAVSEEVRTFLIQETGCPEEKITLVNAFIDGKEKNALSKLKLPEDIRRELGIGENQLLVLNIGTFIHRKGGDIFAKTAELAESLYPGKYKFVWIGRKPTMYENFKFSHYNSSAYLHLDETENPFPIVAAADVFMLSSREDPFPLVVLEALSLGVPAVAWKESGGAPSAIGNAGAIVGSLDAGSFLEAIEKITSKEKNYLEMKDNAQKNAALFDSSKMLPQLIRVIDQNFDEKINIRMLSPEKPQEKEPEAEKKTADPLPDALQPIFIMGAARSGTSIMLTGLHAAIPNLPFFYEGHITPLFSLLSETIRSYYSRPYLEPMKDSDKYMISLLPESNLENHLSHFLKSRMEPAFGGRHTFIEKTANYDAVKAVPQILKAWPKAIFIFMKRRPIENLVSRQKKFDKGDGTYNFKNECLDWTKVMCEWSIQRKSIPSGQYLEVEQRDIGLYPEKTAKKIARFLNLQGEETERLSQAFKVERPGFRGGNESRVLNLADLPWTPEEKERFTVLCGRMAKEFNYALDDRYFLDEPEK